MTILSIIQNVMVETQWGDSPSVIIASTNRDVKALHRMVLKVGRELRRAYPFPCLRREGSVTLATSTANYALPADFDFHHSDTLYNRNSDRALSGPMTAQDWQYAKLSTATSSLTQNFRLMGLVDNRLYIDPTPTSTENGQLIYFDYQSLNWTRPMTWVTATVFGANSYCWYNGVIYKTTAGGTSGGTTGPTADSGITWVAQTSRYDTFIADSDCVQFEEDLVELGVKAFWKKERRFDGYLEDLEEFWNAAKVEYGHQLGATEIQIDSSSTTDWPNVPDTGIASYTDHWP